jgi:DNA ligase-1
VDFTTLAYAFVNIKGAAGRKAVIRILADLFRENPGDAQQLVYLLEGRLGPPYAAPELGLEDKRLAEAIAEASGREPGEVWQRYRSVGDLALVAAEAAPASTDAVALSDVFAALHEIATTTGAGSTQRRVSHFAELLRRVGTDSAAALVRVASGTVRLGVGASTLVEAISVAQVGDSSLRPAIERAFSRCADLGLVASALFEGRETALDEIRPTPGRPVLFALAERLPSTDEILRRLGTVVAEPKYDGVRIQAQKRGDEVWLFTRRLENVSNAFPEIAAGMREQVLANEVILDGEAVGYDPRTGRPVPLQETARRRRVHGVEAAAQQIPVRYNAFDILGLDGTDLTPRPNQERVDHLARVVKTAVNGTILVAPRTPIKTPADLDRHLAKMLAEGLEGTVAKKDDAPYAAGARTYNWIKLKREYAPDVADTFDVVVVGYFDGRGRRASLGIGAFLGAVYDPNSDRFRTVSRVGTGLSDTQWTELRERLDRDALPGPAARVDSRIVPDVWVEPRYVLEVLAAGLSRSPLHTAGASPGSPGYSLRFPRVVRLRPDRRPEDATTQTEILEMFGQKAGER